MQSSPSASEIHRRDAGRRARALVLALAFLAGATGQAWAGSECPHHGGAHAPSAEPGEHAAPCHETEPRHAHDHAHPHEHEHEHDPEHGPCECLGPCHAPAAWTLPAPAGAAPAVTDAITDRPILPGAAAPRGHVAYLLPYANGPPSLL